VLNEEKQKETGARHPRFTKPTTHVIMFDVHVTMHRDKFFIINQIDALISQIYFRNKTLHVSDSSSVHHQEFFHCTHSNGICHTGL